MNLKAYPSLGVHKRRRKLTSGLKLSIWTLRLDGIFLALAGSTAMVSETVGHFVGIGPFAATRGSAYTIGGFEAHGLAVIIAVLLLRASSIAERKLWHTVGLSTHLFLGFANILYWTSFVQQEMVKIGIVTTILHIAFVVAHVTCLRVNQHNV